MKPHNPLKNLEYTRDVAYFFAAISGAGVVFSIAHVNLSQSLNYWVSVFISLLISAGVLYVIDYGLRKELPFGLKIIFNDNFSTNWKSISFAALLFLILGIRIFVSGYLTWECRTDATQAIISRPEKKDVLSAHEKQTQSIQSSISPIDKDIELLQKQIRESEAVAMARIGKISQDKIKNGEDKYGYHAKIIAKAKRKASAPYRKQLNEKLALKGSFQKSFLESSGLIINDIVSTNESNTNEYHSKVSRNEKYYGYFGVGCLIFAIFIELLLALEVSAHAETNSKGFKKREKKRKTPETSEVSEGKDVSGFQHSETKPGWVSDDNTGFNYIIDNDVVMIQGFSGWHDISSCRKKVNQYLSKNTPDPEGKRVGKLSTNNRNIAKFNLGILLLGGRPIANPFELRAAV